MLPYVLLSIAIVAEVIGTTALKMSDGFTKLWPSVVVVVGTSDPLRCSASRLRAVCR